MGIKLSLFIKWNPNISEMRLKVERHFPEASGTSDHAEVAWSFVPLLSLLLHFLTADSDEGAEVSFPSVSPLFYS